MKNTFKNIFKNIYIVFKTIIFIALAIFLSPILPKSDYCLEDGDCKIGRIIIVDDKEIKIDKNTCLKNNWIWYDKGNYCKIKNTKFHPKEIIYE